MHAGLDGQAGMAFADRFTLDGDLEGKSVGGVAAGTRRSVTAQRAGEVAGDLRAFAFDLHFDGRAGVLPGELEELPLPAQQPQRVGDRCLQRGSQVCGQR